MRIPGSPGRSKGRISAERSVRKPRRQRLVAALQLAARLLAPTQALPLADTWDDGAPGVAERPVKVKTGSAEAGSRRVYSTSEWDLRDFLLSNEDAA